MTSCAARAVIPYGGCLLVGRRRACRYSSGVWIKSKQGELPGFRSSVSLVEPLKLGVFISALVSDVEELSVWTIPALDLLVPAVKAAVRTQPLPYVSEARTITIV